MKKKWNYGNNFIFFYQPAILLHMLRMFTERLGGLECFPTHLSSFSYPSHTPHITL